MEHTSSSFAGTERRQHAVFVTRNTEYHVCKGWVVAVRPRGAVTWSRGHAALRMRLDGHVEPDGLVPLPGRPLVGQRLFLGRGEKSIVSSRVESVERPPKETVQQYPIEDAAPEST